MLREAVVVFAFALLASSSNNLCVAQAIEDQPKPYLGEIVKSGEYYDAAVAIDDAVERDAKEFSQHFDMLAVVNKAFAEVEVDPDFRKGFEQSFANQEADNSFCTLLATSVKWGGSFTLLRVHRKENQHSAIFRIKPPPLLGNSQLSYIDLKLAKDADRNVKVVDLLLFNSGEWMSTTIRQTILPQAAGADPKLRLKLSTAENEFLLHHKKFDELRAAFRARDLEKIREIQASIPESLLQSKFALLIRMSVGTRVKLWDEVHSAAKIYREKFPGDDSMELLYLEAMIADERFDEALAAVDRVDKFIGGDPELNTIRSRINKLKDAK